MREILQITKTAILLYLALSLITGLAYPIISAISGQLFFSTAQKNSINLIAQNFTAKKYFHQINTASNIDPHITVEFALTQSKRISKARQQPITVINNLIEQYTEHNQYINVIKINTALDNL